MCGIVGCITQEKAIEPVVDGLKALEYRGYDSAGVTVFAHDKATTIKRVGRVETLDADIHKKKSLDDAHIAIGHTRWATHGSPTETNAHPHFNSDKSIFVV